ncbi:MAG: enoyl-CoA hydratase-related protein [Acidimicrobiales bacterium]
MELKATKYDVKDQIATITLSRPHRLNAWTGRMHTEYRWLLEQAEGDPEVRAIVVTGDGRGFCAGADSGALEGHAAKGEYDSGVRESLARPGWGVRPEFDHPYAFHFGLTKPTIGAINGAAAGIGLVLACFLDIRFAVTGAKFTTAHGKLNLPAEAGLSWLLPRLVGLGRANELLYTSRPFFAEEAERIGLVNALCEPGELLPHTYRFVKELLTNVSPRSLRETKRQIYTDLHRDIGSAVRDADQLVLDMVKDPAFAEGVRALIERRAPNWPTP